MTKIGRAIQVGTEQGEMRRKGSSHFILHILLHPSWSAVPGQSPSFTALKILHGMDPQVSFMVPGMPHKLIPDWGGIPCVLLQRGFLMEMYL